jgi:N-acetylneuraminate lyase
MNKIAGLIAAPFTPMDKNCEVMFDRIPAYYDFLYKNGVAGAFINGSTGEGVSLTQKEKVKTTEMWVAQGKLHHGLKIINLVGGTSYLECIESAQMSAEVGVDSIAILAPYYFKPGNAAQLTEFCAKIAETVPEMPVYFYHIPVLTGCTILMFDFLKAADEVIPNLAGIKFTNEDFMDFQSCLNFKNGKYDMLWGRDENLLPAMSIGARGCVGSTYNYAAPLYHQLMKTFYEGDLQFARKLQQLAIDMIRLLGKYGGIATGKAYMKYIGFDCGEFRIPIKNMNAENFESFKKEVNALNMDELFSKV